MDNSNEKYTPEKVIQAIQKARGKVSLAARALGCTRKTVLNYAERHPEVKQALEDARESMLDIAEDKLYNAIKKGSLPAIFFYLKTQGKDRGYVERSEKTGANGGPLQVQWMDALSDDDDIGVGADELPPTG